MLDAEGKILYIGKAKNLKNRLKQYTTLKDHPYRILQMISQAERVTIIETNTETEALILEANLIKSLKPKYNILLRDDKSFPYIYININHDFPGIFKHRGKQLKPGKYYGPFIGANDIYRILNLLKKTFQIRSCTDQDFASRKAPCMEYQIKRCSAPCVAKVSKEEYALQISEIFEFLNGKSQKLQTSLIEQMQLASNTQKYENAAKLRDRIRAIRNIAAKQNIISQTIKNADVISITSKYGKVAIEFFIYRLGMHFGNLTFFPKTNNDDKEADILAEFIKQFYLEKEIPKEIILNKKISQQTEIATTLSHIANKRVKITIPKIGERLKLSELVTKNALANLERKHSTQRNLLHLHLKLKEIFQLQKTPREIEIYDNSHISGSNMVGAMVKANLDGFVKKQYRKYNIKSEIASGDDYAMLKEVLTRRFKRLQKEDPENKNKSWPDLLIIDGGIGQKTQLLRIFKQLKISLDFICISKGKERILGKERFCNSIENYFHISDKELLFYLQRLRDEAHNFAITSMRKKAQKNINISELDQIPGIGAKRKKALLNHFTSLNKIKSASVAELSQVADINSKTATDIYNFFH
jgi:excinuclease ABC subunit C